MISILHPVFILGNDRISSVQAESLNTRETVSCENCQAGPPKNDVLQVDFPFKYGVDMGVHVSFLGVVDPKRLVKKVGESCFFDSIFSITVVSQLARS